MYFFFFLQKFKTLIVRLVATPLVASVLTINSNDLPAIPPSAIAHQRANLTRPAGRPPRIPRGESVTRQKKQTSPIKEQQEDIVLTEEIHVTSKRRIKTKHKIIEDTVEVIIEQQNEILPDIIKQVQTTPLRGRKKKILQEDINNIPQLEPPAPLVIENEVISKKTRGGRKKKKVEEEIKPTRTTSRSRKKQPQEEVAVEKEEIPPPPKRTTRNKKLVEPVNKPEEVKSMIFPIFIFRFLFRNHLQRKFVLLLHGVKRNHQLKYLNLLFHHLQRKQQLNQEREKTMKLEMKIQLILFKYEILLTLIILIFFKH
jgi:hypothetical protein